MNPRTFIAAMFLLMACNTRPKEKAGTTESADNSNVSSVASTQDIKSNLPYVYGIDISRFEGDEMDFIDKKDDTLSFIICKATEGFDHVDSNFKKNWKVIQEKGFIRGAYHFYHCDQDPVKQALHFVNTVDSFAADDLPPIIDFEETKANKCNRTSIVNLLMFLKTVQEKTGRKPLIYTNNNDGNKYMSDTAFAKYPLFIAYPSEADQPLLPGAWKNKEWALWQRSWTYFLNSTANDFDVFNGSLDDLRQFISTQMLGK